MNGPLLLIAILLAFAVFGATLSSIARLLALDSAKQRWLRRAHGVVVACVLTAMGAMWAVSEGGLFLWLPPAPMAMMAGAVLVVAALAAMALEEGWQRATPLPLAIFGGVVASGAPFVTS